jgi:hypothetical protein
VGISGRALLFVLALVTMPAGTSARAKSIKMVGITTVVEPTRISVAGTNGQEITVIAKEDLTAKVAVGSQVTIWYTPKDGVNYLDWMTYPLEEYFTPGDQIRRDIKKVIILPTYGVPDSKAIVDEIQQYLERNLGWWFAPSMLAEEIRRRTTPSASTLADIDPASGQFNMANYLEEQHRVVREVLSEARVDAVLEINIERVMAHFVGSMAEWDGAGQVISTKLVRALSVLTRMPDEGDVPAVTVDMKLWGPQGKLLWCNRRGFAVLVTQTSLGASFRDRPLAQAYQDEKSVQKWLDMTLGNLAPGKPPETERAASGASESAKP